jgi:hypothetical protein
MSSVLFYSGFPPPSNSIPPGEGGKTGKSAPDWKPLLRFPLPRWERVRVRVNLDITLIMDEVDN